MDKKIYKILISVIILVIIISGCGNKGNTKKSTELSNEKTKITVASSGSPKPFVYVDDKNELTGYDIEVVKALFEKLPEYELSFEKTEFTSVLSGLDTDRYQIGANNFAMNEERKEKYIYSDPIFQNHYAIAVPEDKDGITSFENLKGKSTEVSPGLNYATALENYNKENPDDQVKIDYSEADLLNVLQSVESGKYDFQLIDKAMGQQYIDEHNLKLKLIDLSESDTKRIGTPYSYLLISKSDDGQALADKVNTSLKEIIEDGTVKKISEKYFGEDFAPKDK